MLIALVYSLPNKFTYCEAYIISVSYICFLVDTVTSSAPLFMTLIASSLAPAGIYQIIGLVIKKKKLMKVALAYITGFLGTVLVKPAVFE